MLTGKLESFWQTLFGVFYIMTEQSNHYSKVNTWSMFRCSILFLLDTGQVEIRICTYFLHYSFVDSVQYVFHHMLAANHLLCDFGGLRPPPNKKSTLFAGTQSSRRIGIRMVFRGKCT